MKKPKTALAILIDPFACEIKFTEIEPENLESYYAALSHETMPVRCFEVARHDGLLAGRDAFFFDEEGLFKEALRACEFRDATTPILGKVLVVGADKHGDTINCQSDLERIRAGTKFLAATPFGFIRTLTPWKKETEH